MELRLVWLLGLGTVLGMQGAAQVSKVPQVEQKIVSEIEQKVEGAQQSKELSPEQLIAGSKEYKPTAKDLCRAAVNSDGVTTLVDKFPRALYDCLLPGFKKVYFGGILRDNLPGLSEPVKQMIQEKMIVLEHPRIIDTVEGKKKVGELIITTQDYEGKLRGNLLLDYLKEQEKKGEKSVPRNDYLVGLLLGYTESDIEFFYKYKVFLIDPLYPQEVKKWPLNKEWLDWLKAQETPVLFYSDKMDADIWLGIKCSPEDQEILKMSL